MVLSWFSKLLLNNFFPSHHFPEFPQLPVYALFLPHVQLLLKNSLGVGCLFSEFTHLNLYKIQAINHDENQGSTFFTFFLCIFSMCRASFEVNGNPPCGRDSKWYKTEWELSLSFISHIQGQKYTHTHTQRKRYHIINKVWVEFGYFTKNNPEGFFEKESTLVNIYQFI